MEQLERVEALVLRRAGLQLREQERAALRRIVEDRARKLRLGAGGEYATLLEGGGAQSEAEWAHLFATLTNNESYFFRDTGQMTLLSERILPELIQRNRNARTLRLWSAGCSTGEEPYSLAMLVDELLPDRATWDVRILGTDLSPEALGKARRGVYGPWSFRATSEARRRGFFEHRPGPGSPRSFSSRSKDAASRSSIEGEFEIVARIRQAVTLREGNLTGDAFPSLSSGIHDMDLILCRNVFIYFSREAVESVLQKFARSLRPEGYLLTGHAELQGALPPALQPRNFPQTIIYQRALTAPTAPALAPPAPGLPARATITPASVAPAAVAPVPLVSVVLPQAAGGAVGAASAGASTWRHEPAASDAAAPTAPALTAAAGDKAAGDKAAGDKVVHQAASLLEQARAAADAGRHDLARELCHNAMRQDALSAMPHQLLASIALEEGDQVAAKSLLKKVIYLAPGLVWPYIEMDELYRREGDHARARTMRRAALQVLEALPPQSTVPHATDSANLSQPSSAGAAGSVATASQLIEHLKSIG